MNFFQTETILLGLVWVQSLATCVTGECFIHCAMPLWQIPSILVRHLAVVFVVHFSLNHFAQRRSLLLEFLKIIIDARLPRLLLGFPGMLLSAEGLSAQPNLSGTAPVSSTTWRSIVGSNPLAELASVS